MKRVLLVYPPFNRLHGISTRFFPVGMGYLAGALRAAGCECAIYNAENYDDDEPLVPFVRHGEFLVNHELYLRNLEDADHYVWHEVEQTIRDYEPDVVGVTVKSCMIPGARRISRIAKKINPRIKVIWGGPHPSICPDETMSYEDVDFAARHEGEQTVVEFVRELGSARPDWLSINGLVWRDDKGDVRRNATRENVPELDSIPFPAKGADLRMDRYEPRHLGVLFASRGCPWPCTFCDSSAVWTRRIRYRSAANVVDEMAELYEQFGTDDFYFWDDTFTPNRKVAVALFDEIIRRFTDRSRKITWQATTRCDCVDVELVRLMKRAGCNLLTFGIETGSPEIMKIIRKGITHEKVERAVRCMKAADVPWDAFFMIGFPDDTFETIEQTMQMIRRLPCRTVGLSIFTPYPGTEMHERAKRYSLIPDPIDWRHFSHQSPHNHFVKDIPREQFEQIVDRVFTEVDRLNSRRYHTGRLRHYLRNPGDIPALVARRLLRRPTTAKTACQDAAPTLEVPGAHLAKT